MYRKAEIDLLNWYKNQDRFPLIIRGARQVGKSTLVRNFCKKNNIDLIEVNLEKKKLNSFVNNDINISDICQELEVVTLKKINDNSLVFIDEIQEQPNAIRALRYFYEDIPHVPVIAAGSLLELVLKEEDFSFPVGRVSFYHLGTMTFSEFLLAVGEEMLDDHLNKGNFSKAIHDKATSLLKKYFFIGGMPKAISTFIKTESLLDVREVQNQIIQTYIADFPKYKKRLNISRMEKVFSRTAFLIGKKVIYQTYDSESKSRDIKSSLQMLEDARVLLPVHHVNASGTPLCATVNESILKYYFLDIGLVNCVHNLDWQILQSEFNQQNITKGELAEQFVAQHLAYCNRGKVPPALFYWLRDKTSSKAEVDFVIEKNNQIIPVEVKAQKGSRINSLFIFCAEKNIDFGVKFSLEEYSLFKKSQKVYTRKKGEVNKTIKLYTIPLYAIGYDWWQKVVKAKTF